MKDRCKLQASFAHFETEGELAQPKASQIRDHARCAINGQLNGRTNRAGYDVPATAHRNLCAGSGQPCSGSQPLRAATSSSFEKTPREEPSKPSKGSVGASEGFEGEVQA